MQEAQLSRYPANVPEAGPADAHTGAMSKPPPAPPTASHARMMRGGGNLPERKGGLRHTARHWAASFQWINEVGGVEGPLPAHLMPVGEPRRPLRMGGESVCCPPPPPACPPEPHPPRSTEPSASANTFNMGGKKHLCNRELCLFWSHPKAWRFPLQSPRRTALGCRVCCFPPS